ncbi:MAG: putative toxin-antitoxin system toxin component, PIN family [Peptococcaceae bacterium]|nr:putative toxin-antitoxin system toxin component, PIN family [Peptococcaceae bacterium]
MLVVIDTHVLVSALWSKNGNPKKVLDLLLNRKIKPCFDSRVLVEYQTVLLRPHFKFSSAEVLALMSIIETSGVSVVPMPIDMSFIDEDDKKFYEVAKHCCAKLITGNLKHFPDDAEILTPMDFLKMIYGKVL